MPKKRFVALDVAAPSARVDPLSPWVEPYSNGDLVVSATFWASFQGLSAFVHVVAVVGSLCATLLPIPFLAATCSTVKQVQKPPEPVEIALVKAPEPPPPPPIVEEPKPADDGAAHNAKVAKLVADDARIAGMLAALDTHSVSMLSAGDLEMRPVAVLGGTAPIDADACTRDADCGKGKRCESGACVVKPKKKSAHKDRDDAQQFGMIGLLGARDGDNVALGALTGNEIGDSFGVGGLGLSGVGEGGGGRGEGIGIGSLGTIGHGSGGGAVVGVGLGGGKHAKVHLTLDGVDDAVRARFERRLRVCDVTAAVHGVVAPSGPVTSEPKNACVESTLHAIAGHLHASQPYDVTPVEPR